MDPPMKAGVGTESKVFVYMEVRKVHRVWHYAVTVSPTAIRYY